MREIAFTTDAYPNRPGLDTSIARALLQRVSAGLEPETLRINIPGAVVAFGRRDVTAPGYAKAVSAARRAGFESVERLAGGRAALFHPHTLAFSWTMPVADSKVGIHDRFRFISGLICSSLQDLGLDARVGLVPGEYCPGDYSVNIGGTHKVMGVGQRLARNAAHIGGVIVVSDAGTVIDVLTPVYAALELEWVPATTGAITDHAPELKLSDVADAFLDRIGAVGTLRRTSLNGDTLALAAELEHTHLSPGMPLQRAALGGSLPRR